MRYQRSSTLFQSAKNVIPGGVNSPVRAFKAVGGTPIFVQKAKGAYLFDEDGNTYVIPKASEFEVEKVNALDELCVATPSIARGNLLIRTATSVYCITSLDP